MDTFESCRRSAGWPCYMQKLRQDLRYGARMSLNRPAFALIAVLALSLGVDAIGLKPGLVGVAQGQAEISLEGDWIGGWQDKGAWVFAKAQFKTEQGTLKAGWTAPLSKESGEGRTFAAPSRCFVWPGWIRSSSINT